MVWYKQPVTIMGKPVNDLNSPFGDGMSPNVGGVEVGEDLEEEELDGKEKESGELDRDYKYIEYRDEFVDRLIKHMAEGYSFRSFGAKVGVPEKVLNEWRSKYPRFYEAKEIGEVACQYFFERKWKESTMSPEASKSLNAATWIFNMKNKAGWKDRIPGEDDTNCNLILDEKTRSALTEAIQMAKKEKFG